MTDPNAGALVPNSRFKLATQKTVAEIREASDLDAVITRMARQALEPFDVRVMLSKKTRRDT